MTEDKIVMKKINEIRPYARNPRRNDKTVELLADIIPKVGFNVPLVIDENGIIVKGHARFAAAIRLGLKELPCIVTHADAEAVKVDRITDNKIAEYSEWINDEVLQEIQSINTDIDFGELGFPVVRFDDMPSESPESLSNGFQINNSGIVGVGQLNPVERLPEANKVKKYFKCVCGKCGHVMFVDADKV